MSLHAITRLPSRHMDSGELTHLKRIPIDAALAILQHAAHHDVLAECGVQVQVLAGDDLLPDCAFVEDTAVIFPEVTVLCRTGARTRRAEIEAVVPLLPDDRPVFRIEPPATLEGGDVVLAGRDVFVGRSTRTNEQGVQALQKVLGSYGYRVSPVAVPGALHLKTACTLLDSETLLINRRWVNPGDFPGFTLLDVAPGEPFAANVLKVGERVLVQAAFPLTADAIEARGHRTMRLDISEFAKAEAGLTCLSLIFDTESPAP